MCVCHHFQCSLERHPSAVSTSQWKGGPLRIDPLATVQVSRDRLCPRLKVYTYCYVDIGALHDDSWFRSERAWITATGGL